MAKIEAFGPGRGEFLVEDSVDQFERLRAMGLVDDASFARYWIENRERFSPRGKRAIRSELFQKGLTSEVIAENVADNVDEEVGARDVARRQAFRYARLDRQEFRQKMWAFLARKGFSYEVIQPVIEESWLEVGGGGATEGNEEADPPSDAEETVEAVDETMEATDTAAARPPRRGLRRTGFRRHR
jgi:SOS response regulatory protein OraA/RecX